MTDLKGIRILDPKTLHFFRHGSVLRLTIAEELSVLKVTVLSAFPLSRASQLISVRDGKSAEVGMISDVEILDPDDKALVLEELRRRYVRPVLQRILELKERFGSYEWKVETDRGPCSFATWNLNENVHALPGGRRMVVDVDENRFEIPEKLDHESRRILGQHGL